MRSMIISVKSSFYNTPVQSVLRFVVQTLLATIVLLDDHSLGVRSFKEKRLPCFQYEQKHCEKGIGFGGIPFKVKPGIPDRFC